MTTERVASGERVVGGERAEREASAAAADGGRQGVLSQLTSVHFVDSRRPRETNARDAKTQQRSAACQSTPTQEPF